MLWQHICGSAHKRDMYSMLPSDMWGICMWCVLICIYNTHYAWQCERCMLLCSTITSCFVCKWNLRLDFYATDGATEASKVLYQSAIYEPYYKWVFHMRHGWLWPQCLLCGRNELWRNFCNKTPRTVRIAEIPMSGVDNVCGHPGAITMSTSLNGAASPWWWWALVEASHIVYWPISELAMLRWNALCKTLAKAIELWRDNNNNIIQSNMQYAMRALVDIISSAMR